MVVAGMEGPEQNVGWDGEPMQQCGYGPLLQLHRYHHRKWREGADLDSPWLQGNKRKTSPLDLCGSKRKKWMAREALEEKCMD